MRMSRIFASAVGIALIVVLSTCSQAAGPRPGGKIQLDDLLGKTRTLPGLKDEADDEKPIVHVSLTPSTAKTSGVVTLSVTVSLPADAYTYSTSPGTAGATQIAITEAAGLEPQGEFEADRAPILIKDPVTGKTVEKFERVVTWLRPYVMTAPKAESVRVRGTIEFKYCNRGSCRAFSQPIRAQLINDSPTDDGNAEKANPADGFTQVIAPTAVGGRLAPTSLTATLSPRTPHPGDIVTLGVTLNLDGGWHTFSTTQPESIGSTTTQFTLIQGKSLRPLGDAFQPDREPALMAKEADNVGAKEVYYGKVTWTRRFKFEPKPGETGLGIEGEIHYGVCNDSECRPPKTETFTLGDLRGAGPLPAAEPDTTPKIVVAKEVAEGSLWFYLGGAFLGGILLNVMPCVLPVLAIKVLSFVQQAGESRSRIFFLNVAYTVGVLAVFLTLATLAVGTKLGLSFVGDFSWGGLFQHTRFNLVMACVVFGMGLSLLGVFEIPVPGMVGSAAGQNQSEGVAGAFLTGIFATLLATPCTGPLMATALGWSIRQPPLVVYLIWGVMGLGMASPYLALGLFPKFIKLLPKPARG